jgi:hypothetical protein
LKVTTKNDSINCLQLSFCWNTPNSKKKRNWPRKQPTRNENKLRKNKSARRRKKPNSRKRANWMLN